MASESDILSEWGITPDGPKKPVTDAKVKAKDPDADILKEWGVDKTQIPTQSTEKPLVASTPTGQTDSGGASIPTPERNAKLDLAAKMQPEPSQSDQANRGIQNSPLFQMGSNIAQDARSSMNALTGGLHEVAENRTASGLGNAAMGAMGVLASPLSGVARYIGQEATKWSGSPEIGERAEAVSNLLVPTKGATKAAKAVQSEERALNFLADNMSPQEAQIAHQRILENPHLSLMDVSPNAEAVALGSSKGGPGTQKGTIREAIDRREASAPSEVASTMNAAGGPAPNVKTLMDSMKDAQQHTWNSEIRPQLDNIGAVDITPVLNDLASKIPLSGPKSKAAQKLEEIEGRLYKNGIPETDPHKLHDIQSDLRVQAEDLYNSTVGSEKPIARAIDDVQKRLVEAIDAHTGGHYGPDGQYVNGKYKAGLQQYADDKALERAFQKGQEVFSNSRKDLDTRPEYWKHWWENEATPAEKGAVKLGVRDAMESNLNLSRNPASATSAGISEIPFNKAKLDVVYGKEVADKLASSFKASVDKNRVTQRVKNNSTTAEAQATAKALEPREVGGFNMNNLVGPTLAELMTSPLLGHGVGGAAAVTGQLAYKGAQKLGQISDRRRNNLLAEIVSKEGPETSAKLLALIAKRNSGNLLQKAGNTIAPIVAAGNPNALTHNP